MAFGGKVHDDIRAKTFADLPHRECITNVGLSKQISRITSDTGEIVKISCVSQFIYDAYLVGTLPYQVPNHR